MDRGVELSVVVPVFNEVESLPELYERLVKTLDNTGLHPYELIFVDDGSTDGSFARLQELSTLDARVRVIKFTRNFGQHEALSAGMERSSGEIIIFIDADLQNAPEDIPRFIVKIREGSDLVSGWRLSRQRVGMTRWLGSWVVNHVMTYSTGVFLHDHGCGYKAMTRRVAQEASRYGHLRRFLVPLLLTLARSVGEVTIADNERRAGTIEVQLPASLLHDVRFLNGVFATALPHRGTRRDSWELHGVHGWRCLRHWASAFRRPGQ